MAVAAIDLYDMFLDLNGFLNAGGKLNTYASGGTTPLATYADKNGNTANPTTITLDSSGQTKIWITKGVSYKFEFCDPNGVVLYTKDGISVDDTSALITAAISQAFDLAYDFLGGPPTSSQELFRYNFTRSVTFPANFSGAHGSVGTHPAASFVETVKKNGSTVGTVTTTTGGVSTFATSGGATVSFLAGDILTVTAPSSTDSTVANIARTFAGTLG